MLLGCDRPRKEVQPWVLKTGEGWNSTCKAWGWNPWSNVLCVASTFAERIPKATSRPSKNNSLTSAPSSQTPIVPALLLKTNSSD